jgi:Ser/Thr protein kinase RdoA (MazF antagonist)
MEHSVLQKLASVDFPAPRLVPDATGQTLVEHDGHRYALFDFVENGYHFHHYILTPGQHRYCLESCAEALGVLHEKLQGFVPAGSNADGFTSYDSGRGRDLDWVLERLANSATVDPKDSPTDLPGGTWSSQGVVSELQQTFVELHARLTREDLPRSIIHADYGPYNILVRRGAPPVVLDFEMVRLDWKVVDLVRALYRFTHGRLGFDTDKMRCFVTAYCRESSLHPAERWWAPVVWRYTLVRQALLHWAEGRDAPTKTAESKLERSLYTLRWVASHQDELRALLGAQKNPSPTSAAKESREQPTLG